MTSEANTNMWIDVPLEILVRLDQRSLSLRKVLALQAGSVITMPRLAGENIDLLVGDEPIANGEIVIIENIMGVRLTAFNTRR